MKDISAAIAAAHQSSGKVIIAEQAQDREALRQALEECFHTQRDLLAALDAAQGEAVAWVKSDTLEKVEDLRYVGTVLCRDQRPGHTAVFTAPPAPPAAVADDVARDAMIKP